MSRCFIYNGKFHWKKKCSCQTPPTVNPPIINGKAIFSFLTETGKAQYLLPVESRRSRAATEKEKKVYLYARPPPSPPPHPPINTPWLTPALRFHTDCCVHMRPSCRCAYNTAYAQSAPPKLVSPPLTSFFSPSPSPSPEPCSPNLVRHTPPVSLSIRLHTLHWLRVLPFLLYLSLLLWMPHHMWYTHIHTQSAVNQHTSPADNCAHTAAANKDTSPVCVPSARPKLKRNIQK